MNREDPSNFFVISAPSGAGKTSLVKALIDQKANCRAAISHTTRPKRSGEIDGKDYYFVSKEEFDLLVKENRFFEYANIFDNNYGTLKKPVLDLLSKGKDVLFDIDWQGTHQLKKIKDLSLVTFFILPPNIKILRQRLLSRHEGQEQIIEKRMNKFNEEVSHWKDYNYVVVNDNLEECYKKIFNIIDDEKKGVRKQQNIDEISNKIRDLTA